MLFMPTFCLVKELSIPISHLYKGRIQISDLMTYDCYTNIWKKILAEQMENDMWIPIVNAMITTFKKILLKGTKKLLLH